MTHRIFLQVVFCETDIAEISKTERRIEDTEYSFKDVAFTFESAYELYTFLDSWLKHSASKKLMASLVVTNPK